MRVLVCVYLCWMFLRLGASQVVKGQASSDIPFLSSWSTFYNNGSRYSTNDNSSDAAIRLIYGSPPPAQNITFLIFTYPYVDDVPGTQTDQRGRYGFKELLRLLSDGQPWLHVADHRNEFRYEPKVPGQSGTLQNGGDFCKPFYRCFFETLGTYTKLGFNDDNNPVLDGYFEECMEAAFNDDYFNFTTPSLTCVIEMGDLSEYLPQRSTCSGADWELTSENWDASKTDQGLQTFINGGSDIMQYIPSASSGIWWPGLQENDTLANELGRQLLGRPDFQCTLEVPCKADLKCGDIGSRTALALQNEILKSRWGFFVIASLLNLNQQMSNQWHAIGAAAASTALDTFNIDTFYPDDHEDNGIAGILSGLGSVMSLFSGIAPVATGGTVLGALSSFFSGSLDQSEDPNLAQKQFAPRAKAIYRQFGKSLNDAANLLFKGEMVNGTNLTDLLQGGAWIDSSILTQVTDLETQMNIEIVSRAINDLWKTPPKNKLWVLFVDLMDINTNASCVANMDGPQDSKYCADGGVYYAYNFREPISNVGYVAYPWGGDQMEEAGLELRWVTEASAKTYRLAKKIPGADPFNLSLADAAGSFRDITLAPGGCTNATQNLTQCGGRYPGSWTLPVCDASTWGLKWNFDYNTTDYSKKIVNSPLLGLTKSGGHPPCLCGPLGVETASWVNAAHLKDYNTFHRDCTDVLTSKDFQWPPGVDSVDYGFGEVIKRPGT